MECYQVSSAAVPLLMKRAVECEMETLRWGRERVREREEVGKRRNAKQRPTSFVQGLREATVTSSTE